MWRNAANGPITLQYMPTLWSGISYLQYNGWVVVYLLQRELSNSTLKYPLVGVIFMVILHVIIMNIYPNLLSNYHPTYTFWAIYPLYAFTRICIRIDFTRTLTDWRRRNGKVFSFVGILFLIETMIYDRNYIVITILNCTIWNGNVLIII